MRPTRTGLSCSWRFWRAVSTIIMGGMLVEGGKGERHSLSGVAVGKSSTSSLTASRSGKLVRGTYVCTTAVREAHGIDRQSVAQSRLHDVSHVRLPSASVVGGGCLLN